MLVAQVSTSPVLEPKAVLPPAAAKCAGQPAAAALLDQDQQDQEQADEDEQDDDDQPVKER